MCIAVEKSHICICLDGSNMIQHFATMQAGSSHAQPLRNGQINSTLYIVTSHICVAIPIGIHGIHMEA